MTTTPTSHRSAGQRLILGAQLIAAALGAAFSYDFGMRISGLPLAVLLAANGAFFGAIMVGYLVDLVRQAKHRRGPDSSHA
jgi:hypothetical protein